MGLHESQSRLWENLVGRSSMFWHYFFPKLRDTFPDLLSGFTEAQLCLEANRVERTCIRVDADEVTYNLHIILRYQLELSLLRGDLRVKDLPEAWNDGMGSLLGIKPATSLEGVLQDIHWAWGELGYFPTYALGNLYSASLYRAARKDLPSLDNLISVGNWKPLKDWLNKKIHREGYRCPAEELVQKVTGDGLNDADFIEYLTEKYQVLYHPSDA